MVSGLRFVQPSVRGSRGRSPSRQTNSWRAAVPGCRPVVQQHESGSAQCQAGPDDPLMCSTCPWSRGLSGPKLASRGKCMICYGWSSAVAMAGGKLPGVGSRFGRPHDIVASAVFSVEQGGFDRPAAAATKAEVRGRTRAREDDQRGCASRPAKQKAPD